MFLRKYQIADLNYLFEHYSTDLRVFLYRPGKKLRQKFLSEIDQGIGCDLIIAVFIKNSNTNTCLKVTIFCITWYYLLMQLR